MEPPRHSYLENLPAFLCHCQPNLEILNSKAEESLVTTLEHNGTLEFEMFELMHIPSLFHGI